MAVEDIDIVFMERLSNNKLLSKTRKQELENQRKIQDDEMS
jgi:hypothetical protein